MLVAVSRIRILGAMELVLDDVAVMLPGMKPKAILAVLALEAGRVVPASRLVDSLWGDAAPPSAVNALQVHVSTLRRSLQSPPPSVGRRHSDALLTRAGGYLLKVALDVVDAHVFDKLCAKGRRELSDGDYATAAATLRSALELWGGEPLADLSGFEFVNLCRDHYAILRLQALMDRLDADLGLGRAAAVIPDLEQLARKHPLQERVVAQLMTAHYRSGDQSQALKVYERARAALRDQLGVDPSPEVQRLHLRILRHDETLQPSAGRTSGIDDLTRHASAYVGSRPQRDDASTNLPLSQTPLIGRTKALAELSALLTSSDIKLVSLTGPGGCGKTSLSIAAATRLIRQYADGVFFMPLAAVTAPDVMWTSIAGVVGLPPRHRGRTDLLRHLARRSVLLVLDNLEQLPGADAVVTDLLSCGHGLTIMTTTRRPLSVPGEHVCPVLPLDLPPTSALKDVEAAGSVQLFVQIASMVHPAFILDDSNSAEVAAICHRSDGLPLAIKLVAARSRVLSPRALLARLDNMLDIAAADTRDRGRQRSLRDTIDWSYHLLPPVQQACLRRLSVFAGGAEIDAAVAILGSLLEGSHPIDLIAVLVEASLVIIEEETSGEPRIRLLETIRAFSRDQCARAGEIAQLSQASAEHYLQTAKRLGGLYDVEPAEARRWAEIEMGNFREALNWALDYSNDGQRSDQVPIALALSRSLHWFWFAGGYVSEGLSFYRRAITAAGAHLSAELACCLSGQADLLMLQRDFESARSAAIRSLEVATACGDDNGIAQALGTLGAIQRHLQDFEAARDCAEAALAIHVRSGDSGRQAIVVSDLADIEAQLGHYARAEALARQAVAIYDHLGNRLEAVAEAQFIAYTRAMSGRVDEAKLQADGLISSVLTLGDPRLTIGFAETYGDILVRMGEVETGAFLFGAAQSMREKSGLPFLNDFELRQTLAAVEENSSLETWHRNLSLGRDGHVERILQRLLNT